LLARIAHGLLSLPQRAKDQLYCLRLRQVCTAASDATFTPQTRIFNSIGPGAVVVGSQSMCMGELLVIAPSGRIVIGDWCYVGPDSRLGALESIEVGNRVFISHGVQVFDNNSHSLSASERHERYRELRTGGRHLIPEQVAHRPVRIEDDVWIGFNAAVLKGVTLGRGAVVGAGAVVTHDVPPYAVVVGNPARQVGQSRP
jgi:acetyltransferase-like isoleucine patch superfamily enzyme